VSDAQHAAKHFERPVADSRAAVVLDTRAVVAQPDRLLTYDLDAPAAAATDAYVPPMAEKGSPTSARPI